MAWPVGMSWRMDARSRCVQIRCRSIVSFHRLPSRTQGEIARNSRSHGHTAVRTVKASIKIVWIQEPAQIIFQATPSITIGASLVQTATWLMPADVRRVYQYTSERRGAAHCKDSLWSTGSRKTSVGRRASPDDFDNEPIIPWVLIGTRGEPLFYSALALGFD